MGHIVIIDPVVHPDLLKSSRVPIKVIHTIEVTSTIGFRELLSWLSYEGDASHGWPDNRAQTFSRVSTARFNPAVNFDLWVDEDGIAKDLPYNEFGERFNLPYPLWGRVIVTAPVDGAGNTPPMNDGQLASLKQVVGF